MSGTSGTMRAAVYHEFRGPVAVEEVPRPAVPPDGVIVEVAATGLCRSDWHGWQGHDGDVSRLPHIPGHEFSGTVLEAGPGVRRFRRGDRVLAPFILSCGGCPQCYARRHPTTCEEQLQPGFHLQGSFAQYIALPRADRNLLPLPDGVNFQAGASLGCRFGTAYRGVAVRAGVQQDEWLCITGCGGLGLAAVAIGKALRAKVVACDVRPEGLQRALDLGADAALDASDDEQLRAQVLELTGGGAHVAFEASGSARSAANALHMLRRSGRMVQAGLPLGEHENPRIPLARVAGWELVVLGSHGASTEDLQELMELVEQGRLNPAALVTKELTLNEACEELMAMGSSPPVGVHMITKFHE